MEIVHRAGRQLETLQVVDHHAFGKLPDAVLRARGVQGVGRVREDRSDPVLGGATLLMFGMVAAAGIRIIASQPIGRKETLVLAIAFGLGLGVELCPQATVNGNGVPWILKFAPDMVRNIFSSGLVTGGVAAILANALIRMTIDDSELRQGLKATEDVFKQLQMKLFSIGRNMQTKETSVRAMTRKYTHFFFILITLLS